MDNYQITVNTFNKLAKQYQDKYMTLDLYTHTYDLFCEHVDTTGAEILEIACGPGNITRYLLDKRPDFKILATDMAPNMVELARQNNPEAECLVLDSREIAGVDRQFDAILCGFCLPYLAKKDVERLIGDAAGLLKPGGVLYLSTMEDDEAKSGMQTSSSGDQVYIHYHDGGHLTDVLKSNGFNIRDTRRQGYEAGDNSTTDLFIIASLAVN